MLTIALEKAPQYTHTIANSGASARASEFTYISVSNNGDAVKTHWEKA